MEDLESKTVREIALELPLSTRVFEEFHIDYCCGGRRPFEEACEIAGVSPVDVAMRLEETLGDTEASGFDFNAMPVRELVSHILNKHHVFTKSEISQLTPLMEKVASRHGPNHTSLYILKSYAFTLFEDLASHMSKEETILFPFLWELLDRDGSISSSSPVFGSIGNPLRVMMSEHDRAGELLTQMRRVTEDYSLPDDACPSFTALYARLEDLEKDLHQHIHLENNILFPKALELESGIYPLAFG